MSIIGRTRGLVVLLAVFIVGGFNFQAFQNPLLGYALGAEKDRYLAKGKYDGPYFPTKGWRECRPEAVGLKSGKVQQAIAYAATPAFNTDGLVIIRKGYIAGEAYFGDFKIDSVHVSHSMAKSVTSTLIGIAIDKGIIRDLDERICQFLPAWDCNNKKDFRSRITIRHAMTLTSGLEWKEDWSTWDPATNDALTMAQSGRYLNYMSQRKGLYEPGTHFYYSTGDPMLLSPVIQKATGMTALEFAQKHLFTPLNINRGNWNRDRDGYTITSASLFATVRDYAKFGYLFLNKGRWEDKQIVSSEWVEKATRTDRSVKGWAAYGYLWHVNLPYRLTFTGSSYAKGSIPSDGFMAEGVRGQTIVIIPSKDMVIVRVANETKEKMDLTKFLTMVLSAVEN